MNLLAIETTGANASVAIINENRKIWEEHCDETLNHLRLLVPMIEGLLAKCGLDLREISGIAVSEGPGSFTGIRIGMATAKALAQALNLNIVCVPTLKAFAYSAVDEKRVLCPIFDARRSQIYTGAYLWEEQKTCTQLVPDGAYALEEFLERIKTAMEETGKSKILFFGDGISVYKDRIEEWVCMQSTASSTSGLNLSFAPEALRYQRASSVAALGYELWEQGKAQNLFQIKPVYLRQAEAQRKLEEARRRLVHE